jgi:hypothetical protein
MTIDAHGFSFFFLANSDSAYISNNQDTEPEKKIDCALESLIWWSLLAEKSNLTSELGAPRLDACVD